jgi:hypothetical protein
MRRGFAFAEASAVLEDLSDGQVGEDSHSQDDPEDDFAAQSAASAVEASGILQGLPNLVSADNLLQQEQAVHKASALANGQNTQFLIHLGHSLPDICVRDNTRYQVAVTYVSSNGIVAKRNGQSFRRRNGNR